ncbi:hypothetical protein EJ05DRAFT_505362 [Pseudovirgaria hyperparasitica]|uniref:Zn(2)-C6 fungal-type domain-containing protein n=1 Tax=Pseudovirgaria hyperparasitica TaxID=470096 RepID=A0A6A6VSH2_9PEZI|nr:uncharacterized protein EJ05DRAFT_505362 [Pseudovirgaria hyperparasitica]KAF2753173.1 hypothetical protein EJ05DRAFT_505362 [Pseudovirgaria hyperparasitica]
MVGVGGRSKACANCYRRRIKCDETKPECQRCIKADLKCEGPRETTFIQYDNRGKGRKQIRVTRSTETLTALPTARDISCAGEGENYALVWRPRNNEAVYKPGSKHPAGSAFSLSMLEFHPGLGLLPPTDDIYECYTRLNLLQGQTHEPLVASGFNRSLLKKCFNALATTYFGAKHRQEKLVSHGLQRYGSALRDLNEALGDNEKRSRYDVLESVLVLTIFEFFSSHKEDGWISHSCGLERLMEVRGAESFAKMPELVVLECSRPAMVMAALAIRKPSMFARPEWKTVPWKSYPERRDIVHDLIEHLADVTLLYTMKDSLNETFFQIHGLERFNTLIQQTLTVLAQFKAWKCRWDELHPDCFFEIEDSTPSPTVLNIYGDPVPAWRTLTRYTTLYHANCLGMYNASLIVVLKFYQELLVLDPSRPHSVPDFQDQLFDTGIAICRSVDYHLEEDKIGAGSFYLLFPLRMAWDAVGREHPDISLWLKSTLAKIQVGSAGHWGMAEYLLEVGNRTSSST